MKSGYLAAQLREAWKTQKEDQEQPEVETSKREAPDDLAARLREAATGVDRGALADRAAALREAREGDRAFPA